MAFLSVQEVITEPANVSLMSPWLSGWVLTVTVRIITLQERSFQEKHTSAKLYL